MMEKEPLVKEKEAFMVPEIMKKDSEEVIDLKRLNK